MLERDAGMMVAYLDIGERLVDLMQSALFHKELGTADLEDLLRDVDDVITYIKDECANIFEDNGLDSGG